MKTQQFDIDVIIKMSQEEFIQFYNGLNESSKNEVIGVLDDKEMSIIRDLSVELLHCRTTSYFGYEDEVEYTDEYEVLDATRDAVRAKYNLAVSISEKITKKETRLAKCLA